MLVHQVDQCISCTNLASVYSAPTGSVYIVHQLGQCCKFFKAAAALKGHHTKSLENHSCKCKPASRTGTLAERAVMRLKRKEQQKQFGQVISQGEPLENVLHFLYLGSEFEADGDTMQAVEVHMAIAKQQFGKSTSIWVAQGISMVQKLKLFSAGVVSVLTHGHESWTMHPKILTSLTNWCAICLSVTTGKSTPDEHKHPPFDLVAKLRARRLGWAGQVLRQDTEQSLVKQVLLALAKHDLEQQNNSKGSLLIDAPGFKTVGGLLELAEDTHGWADEVRKLDPDLANDQKSMKSRDANFTLDVPAPESQMGADIHGGG